MKRFLRDNGLTLTVFGLFLLFLAGQVLTGFLENNQEQLEHGNPAMGLPAYLRSGHFLEATMENWESEFLQMGVYVIFTAFLFQRGSSESKDPDEPADADRDPQASPIRQGAPWPVRRGGWVLKVYEQSLSLAFIAMFLVSFALHAVGGVRQYNEEQLDHGGTAVSLAHFIGTPRFWFESFQNWQSEFLSLAAMVYLSVYLRQRGSPESKPVDAPHAETG